MNYATLFNDDYLVKGLAMIRSLLKHHPSAKVYVLNCGSELVERALQLMPPGVSMLNDKNLMRFVGLKKKHGNSPTYYWAAASHWTWFVMDQVCDAVTYVDSDLYFFDETSEVEQMMGSADIGIIPHRWTPAYKDRLQVNGVYNVGWVRFMHTHNARMCLSRWVQQCAEWCENRAMPDGRFADQGYLNNWPDEWDAFVVSHLGANLAPWNQERYEYFYSGGKLHIVDDDSPHFAYKLLFYHFHEFNWPHLTNYPVKPMVRKHVYDEYIKSYEQGYQDVSALR